MDENDIRARFRVERGARVGAPGTLMIGTDPEEWFHGSDARAIWARQLEELDSFSITEYQRYWNESERQAYRRQVEFRQLWPEYETPNELAGQIIEYLRKRGEAKQDESTTELMTVPVLA